MKNCRRKNEKEKKNVCYPRASHWSKIRFDVSAIKSPPLYSSKFVSKSSGDLFATISTRFSYYCQYHRPPTSSFLYVEPNKIMGEKNVFHHLSRKIKGNEERREVNVKNSTYFQGCNFENWKSYKCCQSKVRELRYRSRCINEWIPRKDDFFSLSVVLGRSTSMTSLSI